MVPLVLGLAVTLIAHLVQVVSVAGGRPKSPRQPSLVDRQGDRRLARWGVCWEVSGVDGRKLLGKQRVGAVPLPPVDVLGVALIAKVDDPNSYD